MKKRMILVLCFATSLAFAQREGISPASNVLASIASFGPDGANVGNGSMIFNPPKPIDGTVYVYDNWRNNAVIETTEGSQLRLRDNLNFNAMKNTFEAKMGRDSIFTFDFTNIEKMVVNNKTYKNVYSPVDGGYRIVEVLAENDDFTIYKDYHIDIKEGNPNPMLARSNDKYIMKDSYYVKKGNSFKRFKMRKSDFLKLAGKKSGDLEAFAKKNNLNFKRESDLEKIASYYSTL